MDPQNGHDLAKLSTCTSCEMSEDFSESKSVVYKNTMSSDCVKATTGPQ